MVSELGFGTVKKGTKRFKRFLQKIFFTQTITGKKNIVKLCSGYKIEQNRSCKDGKKDNGIWLVTSQGKKAGKKIDMISLQQGTGGILKSRLNILLIQSKSDFRQKIEIRDSLNIEKHMI
jgi:hypothetical protein